MDEVKLIARKWLHAYEEDEGGNQVFRPEGHKLPPSRGREALDLRKGSPATKSIPGPDDRGLETTMTWVLSKDDVLTFSSIASNDRDSSYKVISLDKNRLVLKRTTEP